MINEKKKKRPAPAGAEKRRPNPKKAARPEPDVIYTPPVPINRKKFILRLLTVAAVVLALFLGCTVFFRVKEVVVTGTERYTPWSVREASGIEDGESLLAFGKTKAAARIIDELRYIKSVRIGITLPDTVNIWVEELEVIYGIQDAQDGWWMIAADGRVVEQTTEAKARATTVLKGLRLSNPVAGEAAQPDVPEADNTQEPVLITDKERLEAALAVIAQLERCEILGEAASIDVTDPAAIQLWYGDDYQVLLGNHERMDEKIVMMAKVIDRHEQEGGYQSGVLDITLSKDANGVIYTPFG